MKKAKQQRPSSNSTPIAVAIATLVGAAALYCGEIIYSNIKDPTASDISRLPAWRAHMGSAFAGSVAFVTALFLLESLDGRSKMMALRSALLWLPLVALTGLATAIHFPQYAVILIVALYSPWAYLRMRSLH